jgi:hypothetical protein
LLEPLKTLVTVVASVRVFLGGAPRRYFRMILDIILDIIRRRVIFTVEGQLDRAATRSCANPLEHSQFYCEEKQ